MAKKESKEITEIELVNNAGNKKTFSIAHAENLMNLMTNKNLDHWKLPEDSNYEFKDGKFYNRTGGTTVKEPEK